MKALSKDPAERYQTAAEMAADLERARTGRPIAAAAVGVAGAAAVGMAATSAIPGMDATQQITPVAPVAYEQDEPPSRIAWYVLLGIATVAVLAGAAWLAASVFGGGGGTKVRVPDLTGLTKAQSQVRLQQEGLTLDPTINTQVSDKPKGTVIAQDPDPQAEAPLNSAVVITVSGGPATSPSRSSSVSLRRPPSRRCRTRGSPSVRSSRSTTATRTRAPSSTPTLRRAPPWRRAPRSP